MKKLTFLVLVIGVAVHSRAQLAVGNPEYDSFADATAAGGTSYTVGSHLSGQTSASYAHYLSTGTAWWEYGPSISATPSVVATNQPTIVAGDLSYPGLYSVGGGQSVSFGGNGDSALLNFTTTTAGLTAGTAYFSFVFQLTDISNLDTNGTYFAALNNLQSHNSSFNTPAALATRVLVRRAGDGFNVGLQEGGANGSTGFNTAWSSAVFSVSNHIFVVGSYTFNPNAKDDVAQLWVNPDASTFGDNTLAPAADLTSSGGTDIARVASFVLLNRATNEPLGAIDDLRIGLQWADVTPSSNYLTITQNPANQTLPAGYNATFTVTANGAAPLAYQWVKDNVPLADGGNIVGAYSNTLVVSNISGADAGVYSAYVTNEFGKVVQSLGATLALYDPSITNQPQSRTNNFGTTASFSVGVTGTGPFTYQWQKDGVSLEDAGNISGSHGNVLTLTNVAYPDGGGYSVIVSNAVGNSLQSSSATLTVNDPIISKQPVSATNIAGGTVSFSVTVNGSQPLTYQWFKNGSTYLFNGANVTGADSNILTLSNISSGDASTYSVLVVGPYGGTVTSRSATLVLLNPLSITVPPNPRTVAAGASATFSVGAVGVGSLGYQWLFAGQPIAGANSSAYTITNAAAVNAGLYSVIVSDSFSSATSAPVNLSVSNFVSLEETNLVVIRVGNGAQIQSLNGNSIFLDQFTAGGQYVNTVNIPDGGSTGIIAVGVDNANGVNSGSTTGSSLTRSLDGRFLVIAGYATNLAYGANLANSYAAEVPRGIGLIDSQGQYNLGLASTDSVFDQIYWRAAITDGTNNFWGSGSKGGTYYFGLSGPGTLVQTTFINARSMGLFNGDMYSAEASNPTGVLKISGLPTTNGVAPQVLFSGSTGTYDLSVSPDGNLIYVADQRSLASGGGIQRWQFDGTTWSLAYTLTNGFIGLGPRYIAVDFTGANPVLYVTSNDQSADNNRLIRFEDSGAASAGVTLANAGVNQTFRGLHFGPVKNNSAPTGPTISIQRDANGLILTWPGTYTLQSAPAVTGPYTDVAGPSVSPYTNSIPAAGQQFFRLRN